MVNTFWESIIENFKSGLLLFVKYILLIAAVWYAFNYSIQTRQMAANGEQAALMILELQKKGYLPQFINGQIPERVKTEEKK